MEHKVATTHELADGQMKNVRVGQFLLLLAKVDGQIHALSGKCPHYGAPLAKGTLCDGRVVCPWHHAVFDVRTGALLEPPALDGLHRFPVRLDGDDIYVDVPENVKNPRTMPMRARDPEDNRFFAIIGGGAAAATAAETLRQEGFGGRLLMISAEDRVPYDRPNCSKDYLAGEAKDEWMPLRSDEFYKQYNIERLHKRVVGFDVPTRTIRFDDAQTLQPDAVLIATGALARTLDVPGSELAGILTLRSFADAGAIIAAAKNAKRAVVIGASFIGMEAAASLAQRGVTATVVAPDRVPFERTLGAELGRLFQRVHEEHGTQFKLGCNVKRFAGDQKVLGVTLDDGTMLAADLVVVGIGVRLATDFIKGVRLNNDGSLIADEFLRVAEGVYAAGDVASFPELHTGQRARIEHWRLAQQHGRAAARSMLGRNDAFAGVPFFWTTQFNLSLGYVGYARSWDEVIISGKPEARNFTAFYAQDGRLVAAAGTQADELGAFSELMRRHQLPPIDHVRGKEKADLPALLRQEPSLALAPRVQGRRAESLTGAARRLGRALVLALRKGKGKK